MTLVKLPEGVCPRFVVNWGTNPMARKTLTMRHIKEILRLRHQQRLSVREIARSCGLSASTVGDYLKRAQAASLSWPLPEQLTEEDFYHLLEQES